MGCRTTVQRSAGSSLFLDVAHLATFGQEQPGQVVLAALGLLRLLSGKLRPGGGRRLLAGGLLRNGLLCQTAEEAADGTGPAAETAALTMACWATAPATAPATAAPWPALGSATGAAATGWFARPITASIWVISP